MRDFLIFLVLVLTLLFPMTAEAQASMVATDRVGTTVTLYQSPCTNSVVLAGVANLNSQLVKAGKETVDELYSGALLLKGKEIQACWTAIPETVFVFTDTGETYMVPTGAFHRADTF